MENLLRDAAFFADREKGIGHFCVEPEKRGDFWNPYKMTKHSTTKPVSEALDELIAGRGIEQALERFMRNLASKISQEEQKDLKTFIKSAKEIFTKYHQLRKEKGISELIRVKNALLSATYVFTRYQDLKEVCK
jgi:hypothetical protein